jgi:RNA polymerase sigma factor (sigma-70 family)
LIDQSNQVSNLPQETGRKRQILEEAIEQHWQRLLAGIRVYVYKFGLAQSRSSIDSLAREVLNDTVVTALEKASNYSPDRPAHAWLLRVAFNHIRHRLRAQSNRQADRLVTDTVRAQRVATSSDQKTLSEEDMLDLLYQLNNPPFRSDRLTVEEMLSLVTESDRKVLQLVFIEDLRGKALAAELGISEGAAYTRTSRAIANLRKAFDKGEQTNEKGNYNAEQS